MALTPILALCGSLRAESLNRSLLMAFEASAPDLRFVGADLVPLLPMFNSDLTDGDLPAAVRELRMLAAAARGAVIVSPEYVLGPSGVTKNALDWLADSSGLYGKPVLVASASPGNTGGLRGIAGLLPTLDLLGATLIDPVTVARGAARLGSGGRVTDAALAARIALAMDELRRAIQLRTETDPVGLEAWPRS